MDECLVGGARQRGASRVTVAWRREGDAVPPAGPVSCVARREGEDRAEVRTSEPTA